MQGIRSIYGSAELCEYSLTPVKSLAMKKVVIQSSRRFPEQREILGSHYGFDFEEVRGNIEKLEGITLKEGEIVVAPNGATYTIEKAEPHSSTVSA